MYIDSNYDYLLCMLNSLDDKHFGKLIGFIYGRKDNRFINPFKTYKELFVNLLLNNKDDIYKETIEKQRVEYFINLRESLNWVENSSKEYQENIIKELKYNLIKNFDATESFYSELYDVEYSVEYSESEILNLSDSEFKKALYSSYDILSLPIKDYKKYNPFIEYVDIILNCIKSFDINRDTLSHVGFNNLVDNIIETQRCYIIKKTKKEEYLIIECILNPIKNGKSNIEQQKVYALIKGDKNIELYLWNKKYAVKINNCTSFEGSSKSLINSKATNVDFYINKFKAIDNTIKTLNKNLEKRMIEQEKKNPKNHRCDICMSEKNIKERTIYSCKICKKLRTLIISLDKTKIFPKNAVKSFNSAIKYVPKAKEWNLSEKDLRELHYENLIKIVTKIYNQNIENENEKKILNEVIELINKAFGDIKPFSIDMIKDNSFL